MYRLLFLVGVLVLGVLRAAQAQYATWSRPLSPVAQSSRSVTDAAGNTYVAGSYRATFTIGASTLAGPAAAGDFSNVYLAKIDAQGVVQWAIGGASIRSDEVRGLALAPNGTVHVAFRGGLDSLGQTQGTNYPFMFGNQTLPTGGTVLATVSPTGTLGTLTYLHQGGGNAEITGMAADATGNTLLSVAGYFGSQFASYTFPRVATGFTYSSAIFRANANGAVALVRGVVPTTAIQGSNYLRLEDLAVDAAGDLYCVGSLQGEAALGGTPGVTLAASGNGTAAFAVKFSSTGVAQWGLTNAYTNGSVGNATGVSVALAPTGEVYVAGNAGSNNVLFGSLAAGTAGGFVVKLSASGAPLWVRAAQASTFDGTKTAVHLAVDAAGNVYKSGILNRASAAFGNNVTINYPMTSTSQSSPNTFYVVSYDPAGTARWARTIDGILRTTAADSSFSNHSATGLGADASGNVYVLNYKTPGFGRQRAQLVINGHILGEGNTLLRLSPASRLSGTLYIDQNNNGVRDAGEIPFPYPQIITDLTQATSFSSEPGTGQYSFYGLPGTAYAVTVPAPHPYYTLHAPTLLAGTFPALGQAVTGQDFGLVPNDNQLDVRVTLTPYGPVRPGFTTRYRLTLENIGTTVASGTASVTLDSRITYVGSAPAGARSGQVVTWTYTNLAPFARLDYDVTLSLAVNTVLGTQLSSVANAALPGDVDPSNNTATAAQTVTGSLDPNDITVNYSHLTPAQVAVGLPLDYTIRFQNMGTDTAFTVVISDALDAARLNLGTMELVAQSHNCLWSLTNRGLLTVRFLNIKLPHRNQDVIRSQGFVRFRVRPRATLAVGDVVPNEADIFFDFNAPVRTNTATTTVMLASAAVARHDAAAWNAYPNPATDAVTISADLATGGRVRLDLLDALGRTVRQQTLTAPAGALRQALDLRGLAPGLYVLRLTPPSGPASTQQLVRE
ncbi:T9SS type A sorting domain-containing protein [Hymenobacter sp. BT189]|uniref:T9SS type A sorting domain-containing protein n=2 Tax=Hymenobacter armeniacus TaxID=2771358 RepID=A0ABR8JWZ8_9BACT|nr:T9SS type A sorting domain-containing protein [Hymenobacter armeniacus]